MTFVRFQIETSIFLCPTISIGYIGKQFYYEKAKF